MRDMIKLEWRDAARLWTELQDTTWEDALEILEDEMREVASIEFPDFTEMSPVYLLDDDDYTVRELKEALEFFQVKYEIVSFPRPRNLEK